MADCFPLLKKATAASRRQRAIDLSEDRFDGSPNTRRAVFTAKRA